MYRYPIKDTINAVSYQYSDEFDYKKYHKVNSQKKFNLSQNVDKTFYFNIISFKNSKTVILNFP